MVSGGCDDDAALGRTEDWGLKGRRAMSVGLGGWEYNPVVRIAKETSITIPINNNPSPIVTPPPTNNNPQILILAGVFPFNAAGSPRALVTAGALGRYRCLFFTSSSPQSLLVRCGFLQFFIEKTSPWRYTWPPWALQMAPLGVTDGPRVAQKSGRLALENMIAGFISLVKNNILGD